MDYYLLFQIALAIITAVLSLLIFYIIKKAKSKSIRRFFIHYQRIANKYFMGDPIYGLGIIVLCVAVALTFAYA